MRQAAKFAAVTVDTLMRMRNSYDIAQARRREGEIAVERFRPKAAPVR